MNKHIVLNLKQKNKQKLKRWKPEKNGVYKVDLFEFKYGKLEDKNSEIDIDCFITVNMY